ncbi:hypothetical protein VNO77_15856 [Canavalia gladiata]|uniref:Uncharacterized protein n=1 Tax=Canavalia gladiata TaxID=3824 RepID=A0AAN9QW22_CANGL
MCLVGIEPKSWGLMQRAFNHIPIALSVWQGLDFDSRTLMHATHYDHSLDPEPCHYSTYSCMLVYEMRFNIQAHRLHTFFTWKNRACIGVKANLYEATVQRVFEILLRISKGVLMRNLGLNPYPGLRSAMCVSSWISRTPLPSPSEEFLACSFFTGHQKNRSSRSRRCPLFFSPPVAQPLE